MRTRDRRFCHFDRWCSDLSEEILVSRVIVAMRGRTENGLAAKVIGGAVNAFLRIDNAFQALFFRLRVNAGADNDSNQHSKDQTHSGVAKRGPQRQTNAHSN